MDSACRRRIRTQVPWNVPSHTRRSAPAPRRDAARSFISRAALFVNVKARIPSGASPRSWTRWAIRPVRTRVFPLPAPARTRSGPPGCSTAWRCTGFSCTGGSVLQSNLEVEVVFLLGPLETRSALNLLPFQEEAPGHAVLRAELIFRAPGEVARIIEKEVARHILSDPDRAQVDRSSGRPFRRSGSRARAEIDRVDESARGKPPLRVPEEIVANRHVKAGARLGFAARDPVLRAARRELTKCKRFPEVGLRDALHSL